MKSYLMIFTVAIFAFGCGSVATTKVENTPAKPEEKPAGTIAVGDTVVAKWTQNSFYEGKVETVSDAKIRVKWSDGSSPTDVDRADVFQLPKAGAKPDAKVGEIVLAKISTGSYWNDAEIASLDGDVAAVKTNDGRTTNVSLEKIIKIPAAVAANFKDRAKTNDFLAEAQTKKPAAPAEYKPKTGEKVLAEWSTNSWWQATVQKVSGDRATVAWEDGSKPSELGPGKIVPMPTAKAEAPKSGQFLLVKPKSGSKWEYARTTSAKDGSVEIAVADGTSRTVKAGEFVVLN